MFHQVMARLDRIERLLLVVIGKEICMSQELDNLTAEVAQVVTVEQSAITLLEGLKAKLDAAIAAAAAGDTGALPALSASLEASKSALAAAVVANTP